MNLRLASLADIPEYRAHFERVIAESGKDGVPIFTPREEASRDTVEQLQAEKKRRWSAGLGELGWERSWVLVDPQGEIRGEIKLRNEVEIPAALHRAVLMMAIERRHHGQGWGRRMIQTVLDWARAQAGLDWVTLCAFSGNERAIALYRKMGFIEQGRVEDAYRVFGQRLTDVRMSIKLR